MSELIPKEIIDAQNWLNGVGDMLRMKHVAYGESATKPLRIFSNAMVLQGLRVRIDDKLSRIARGRGMKDETFQDTLRDLVGYIALLAVSKEGSE